MEFLVSMKKVVYRETYYADNYKHGISTLIFNGENTKLNGGDTEEFYTSAKVSEGYNLITLKNRV